MTMTCLKTKSHIPKIKPHEIRKAKFFHVSWLRLTFDSTVMAKLSCTPPWDMTGLN